MRKIKKILCFGVDDAKKYTQGHPMYIMYVYSCYILIRLFVGISVCVLSKYKEARSTQGGNQIIIYYGQKKSELFVEIYCGFEWLI